jgi:hypothetical protein
VFLGLGCACLLALGFSAAPRLFLLIAWIFNAPRWSVVWGGGWIMPLLGIIFVPYTTVMWMLTWTVPDGVTGWSWLWIILGLMLDVMHWGSIYERRQEIPYASQYTGGAG